MNLLFIYNLQVGDIIFSYSNMLHKTTVSSFFLSFILKNYRFSFIDTV